MARDLMEGISIVIPAYNESQRIVPTLHKVHRFLKQWEVPFEIIVVDDGSTDSTADFVQAEASLLTHLRLIQSISNEGKGSAVRKGVMSAHYGIILLSDADLSSSINNIDKLLKHIADGYDIAIGSRALSGSVIPVRQAFYRRTMGRVFNLIVRALILEDFRDTQCGFKLFTADAAKAIFSRMTTLGFAFDVEALLIAKKLGYRIKETPIEWSNSPNSRVRLLADSLAMFTELLRMRKTHAGLKPSTMPDIDIMTAYVRRTAT